MVFSNDFPFVRRAAQTATQPEPETAPQPPESDVQFAQGTELQAVEAAVATEQDGAEAAPRRVERRKFRRDPMTAQALVRVDDFHGPPVKVMLGDISIAGVRFRCARPFTVGEKGQIRLQVGPLRWTTRLRVIYCNREPDTMHSVGCAFLRTELLRPWPTTAS